MHVACWWLARVVYSRLPVETSARASGQLPAGCRAQVPPPASTAPPADLFAPRATGALLGALDSLLCALGADNLIDDPRPTIAAGAGIANFARALPSIAATVTARAPHQREERRALPIAGMSLRRGSDRPGAGPLRDDIPCALAAIICVAFTGDWHDFLRMQQYSLPTGHMAPRFAAVVSTHARGAWGSFFHRFFIYRMSQLTRVDPIRPAAGPPPRGARVAAWRLFGALFFGSVTKREQWSTRTASPRLAGPLDAQVSTWTTRSACVEHVHERIARAGGRLVLVAPNDQPLDIMRRGGFIERLGRQHVFATLDEALGALGGLNGP